MNHDSLPGDAELRMALRGLRRDVEPETDLWPGIAARISALPRQAPPPRPAESRWLWPLATAASLVAALGLAWRGQVEAPAPKASQPIVVQSSARPVSAMQREAEVLTVQYQAALREIEAQGIAVGLQPGLEVLDRSADEIRAALRRDPESRLLLQRLRDTYTRRLELSRRALYV